MSHEYTQQPVTFLATRNSTPTTSEYSQYYWIAGLVLIAFGVMTVIHTILTRPANSDLLSFVWHGLLLGLWFVVPGLVLQLTRKREISWDDDIIHYKSILRKPVTARFDDVQDWGNFYAALGTWVKFENGPILFYTRFISNEKYLENKIGREIARKRPNQIDGNNNLLSPDAIVVGVLLLLAILLHFINAA